MLRNNFIKKVILGLGCSVIALSVDAGLLVLLVEKIHFHYQLAAAIGFAAGCVVNYLISKYFVFEKTSKDSESMTVFLFTLVGIGGLMLNSVILYIGVDLLHQDYRFVKIVSAGIVFWFNFLIRGYFVFKDPDLCKKQKKTL